MCERIGPASSFSRSVRTASANAPTPGRTTRSTRPISSGLEMICAFTPTVSNAFCTERRFAIP